MQPRNCTFKLNLYIIISIFLFISIYFKDSYSTEKVFIIHQVTGFSKIGSIAADMQIAIGNNDDLVKDAVNFQKELFASLSSSRINNAIIVHTGFSLGGFIAASCVLDYDLSYQYQIKAFTFDSPGFCEQAQEDSQRSDQIFNFVTMPNLVNTCNKHVGRIFQICSEKFNSTQGPQSIQSISDLLPEFISTLDTHDLEQLIQMTSESTFSIKEVANWPQANPNLSIELLEKLAFDLREVQNDSDLPSYFNGIVENINYYRNNAIKYKSELMFSNDDNDNVISDNNSSRIPRFTYK